MANNISIQFENKITTLQELEDCLTQRIADIKSRDGKLTDKEKELQDILDMLPKGE